MSAAQASTVQAQGRLVDVRTVSTGAVLESWSFADPRAGSGSSAVRSARQLTIPIVVVVPVVAGLSLDAYAAYAKGTVSVGGGSGGAGEEYELSGVSDVKLRLSGHLGRDNVLLTLGASLPSGATTLGTRQLQALSVLAAPALRFRTPTLGSGTSATTGLVVAGQAGSWALAAGGAFEFRGEYSPAQAISAGIASPTLRPGHAVHVSLGADQIVANARQSVGLVADIYTSGQLRDLEAGDTDQRFQLGPSLAGTYQLQLPTGSGESTLYLLGRYRSNYKLGGRTVIDSWRLESEIGTVTLVPLTPQASFRIGLDGRMHASPGLARDEERSLSSFATSGIVAGGVTVGLQYGVPGGSVLLEPYVRAQRGQLDLGGVTRTATGTSLGLTLTSRF